MQSLLNYESSETFITDWPDCYVSDSKITGFVCTFQLSNKKHHFYGLNDLKKLITEAKSKKKDIYLSLNAFNYGSRTTKELKQIRNIGVDIDCYNLNITVSQAIQEIHDLITNGKIPNPNLVIYSGRGIQLIYSISGGASPKMAFLTQYITSQFIAELKHLGADTVATDVTRVFRLPFSVNSKNNKQVTVDLWRTLEYRLQELYSYCSPLEKRRKPSKKKKGTLATLPSKKGLKTLYSLNTARKDDLETLVILRNGDIEKRNVLTYIYAYTVALILKNKQATIEFAIQLNNSLAEPQKVSEIKRTAGNAYDDALNFFDEFRKRDFNMWYKQSDGIKRPMKNETIIKELEITTDEIKKFGTVIDSSEKKRRKAIANREMRRNNGVLNREDYLEQQTKRTEEQLWQLKQAMKDYPGAKKTELASMLGVSRRHLYRLLTQL